MTKNNPTPQSFIRLETVCSLAGSYDKYRKKEKSRLLDFLEKDFGLKRNTAARLLRSALTGPIKSKTHLRGRKPIYCHLCVHHLKKLWKKCGKLGPEKMKAAMGLWLPHYACKYKLSYAIEEKLGQMSARTIARLLDPYKKSLTQKNQSKTQNASKNFKYKIPVKAFGAQIKSPGFVEADTVAHCGGSLAGSHHWTLTVTDIHTTWTENVVMPEKTARATKDAVVIVQNMLPFKISNFHSDCGSEFLNQEIMDHLANPKRYIVQTRGRAYKKNDQAHVEQKNHSHVRELLGYYRYDSQEELELIQDIYQNEHRLLKNFFTPQKKLQEKLRVGSRYKRKYGPMKTPYQRVMESPSVSEASKARLKLEFESINPLELQASLENKLQKLWKLKNRTERIDVA